MDVLLYVEIPRCCEIGVAIAYQLGEVRVQMLFEIQAAFSLRQDNSSFGSQTQAGSAFVARMLTVVTTLKSQHRNVLEFMTQAIVAARGGQSALSLLPEVAITSSSDYDLPTAA